MAVDLLSAAGFEGRFDFEAEAPTAIETVASTGLTGGGKLTVSGNVDSARMKPINVQDLKELLALLGSEPQETSGPGVTDGE